jgi:hypothetical protein
VAAVRPAGAGRRRTFDPETLDLLRSFLDDVWAELTELRRHHLPCLPTAERLLRAAAEGERDRDVLRGHALDSPNP